MERNSATRQTARITLITPLLLCALALSSVQSASGQTGGDKEQPPAKGSYIRPREEGRFSVPVSKPKKTATRVIGQIAGHEVTEIDSPIRLGNMGKIMVEDNQGYIWYLETREDVAVRIDPKTLEMVEYGLPKGSGPYSHAIDSKGAHWITAHGIEMLLEFYPDRREVISHATPSFGFLIHINVDKRDDTVYFCQPGNNQIVSYHRERGFKEYPIPTPSAGPGRLDFDSKGNVWFPELYADKIAKLDPKTGKFQEWDLPVKHGTPSFCRVDANDVVWISLPMGDRILSFKDGAFKEYKIPTSASLVSTTVTDNRGYIWFTEGGWRGSAGGNKIGRLDPRTGAVEELPIPTFNAQPLGIIIDRTGTMWFEQMNAGKICRLKPLETADKDGNPTSVKAANK